MSDDVSAGSRALRARSDMYKSEKYLDNVKAINEELGTAETAMRSMNDIFVRVHSELVEKAKSGATGDSGRVPIAQEIKSLKEQLLQFMNTKYESKFSFGGRTVATAPFSVDKDSGDLKYNGVLVDDIMQRADGSLYYLDADGVTEKEIPMDDDVFMDIGLGIKMSGPNVDKDSAFKISYSGIDIMGWGKNDEGVSNNLYNILNALEKNIKTYNGEEVAKYDTQLDILSEKFRSNITEIGSKTSFLETMQDRLQKNVDSYQTRISQLVGINDAEEASRQSMNDYALRAVIQMGSRILPISLMDFLK